MLNHKSHDIDAAGVCVGDGAGAGAGDSASATGWSGTMRCGGGGVCTKIAFFVFK